MTNNLDLYFFNKINGLAGRWKALDTAVIFFAVWLPYLMVAFLFIYAVLQKDFLIFILPIIAGIFSRFIINEAIYFFYKRKRPLEVLQIKSLVKKPKYPAFPSGHASLFFGLSFDLLFLNPILGIAFIVLSCVMAFCRILAGLHWPSDILAGAIVGLLLSLLINLFL